VMPDRPVLMLAPVTAPSQQPQQQDETKSPSPPSPPAPPSQPQKQPKPQRSQIASSRPKRPVPPPTSAEESGQAASAPSESPWRRWGPFHATVSFKWPPELVEELDNRRHDLREPVGLMVIAAVAHLLDRDDETIRSLIDRAEQAKPRSGRGRHRAA
jgi:hypothetical protein